MDTPNPINGRSWSGLRRGTVAEVLRGLDRPMPGIPPEVPPLLADLQVRGDQAVVELARRFDGFEGEAFEVPRERWAAAVEALEPALCRALEGAIRRVRTFAEAQRSAVRDFEMELEGVRLGQRTVAVGRAAVYAPGGRHPLPSSVIMGVVPARVAGVGEVVVLSPRLHPVTLAAAALAGADRVFDLGGVQGVAAAAWGLAGVPKVDLLVGPGNRFVTGAKRLLYGDVGIDFPAGPSELLVVADAEADPARVAADLLAQAEHDSDALPLLVVFDPEMAQRVDGELARQLTALPADTPAWASLANGCVVVAADEDEAVALCNALAPEHLELVGRRAEALAERVTCFGSLFLGSDSAEVFGDYGSGPNHILPTAGAARFTGGVCVGTFLKTLTWQRVLPEGRAAQARDAGILARAEGLLGHARSADLRAAGARG